MLVKKLAIIMLRFVFLLICVSFLAESSVISTGVQESSLIEANDENIPISDKEEGLALMKADVSTLQAPSSTLLPYPQPCNPFPGPTPYPGVPTCDFSTIAPPGMPSSSTPFPIPNPPALPEFPSFEEARVEGVESNPVPVEPSQQSERKEEKVVKLILEDQLTGTYRTENGNFVRLYRTSFNPKTTTDLRSRTTMPDPNRLPGIRRFGLPGPGPFLLPKSLQQRGILSPYLSAIMASKNPEINVVAEKTSVPVPVPNSTAPVASEKKEVESAAAPVPLILARSLYDYGYGMPYYNNYYGMGGGYPGGYGYGMGYGGMSYGAGIGLPYYY